jgi:hypothetical protein
MSKQVLKVDPQQISVTFSKVNGQSNLIVNVPNTLNVSVTNASGYALRNVTLKQGDVHVMYAPNGKGTPQEVTSAFAVTFTQGGQVIFPSVPSSTTPCNPQSFFVTPLSPQALSYLEGTISLTINSDDITYDVVADTGGQSTSDSWTVTTRG